MTKPDALCICLAVAYAVLQVAFGVSNAFLLADIPKISDEHVTTITPANYAFAIWGVIWTLQGISVVWLLVRKDAALAEKKTQLTAKITPWWIVGFSCELAWLWCFAQNTHMFLMFAAFFLATGAFCFLKALSSLELYPGLTFPAGCTLSFEGCVSAACALNGAWLTVASAVGFAMLPTQLSATMWLAPLLAGCAAVVGFLVVYQTKSISFALTFVWAFIAVYFGKDTLPLIQVLSVAIASSFGTLVVVILFLCVKGRSAVEAIGAEEALLYTD